MPRTSPVHYIAPSAISITPNSNNSYNDLSVYIANGAKIKVWSGRAGIGMVDSTYQEWTLKGRNRRLAESGKPYTIYARLSKSDNSNAYLVFAPMEMRGSKWTDKYPCVTTDGESRDYYGTIDPDNWYVRMGEVSLPENNLRTVNLDTGILGTDEYNKEWSLDPDSLPLRVEIRSEGMDAGVPYLRWGGSIILSPVLIKGFDEAATTSVDRWMITRNTGNTNTDNQWNASKANGFTDSIELKHEAGSSGTDDFSASVSATFYISACVADESEITGFSTIATGTITIIAETKEKFEIELSSGTVSYDDTSGRYIPENNINIFIRSIAQDGSVFYINEAWFRTAGLALFYDPVDSEDSSDDTPLVFSGATTGKAVLPITAFASRKSLNVHLVVNNTNVELAIVTVNFIPATRDIHYYTTSETKDLNEGGVGMGAELVYWNPDQSFFSNEESAYFFNEFRPYMWRKTLQYPILIDGTIDDIGDHYEDAILPDGVKETEAPHVIGVYGETGVNYICQTEKDYIAIDTATDKGEFGGSIRFYTDNGGVRAAFPCYCRVYKRTGDTRTLLFNGANLAIFSMPYREIESSVDVVELFAASSINASNPDEMVDTYLIKKEIPLIKAAKGDKGDKGDKGLAGPVVRVHQNVIPNGMNFFDGTETAVAVRYKDYIVVGYPQSLVQSGYMAYECIYGFHYQSDSDLDLAATFLTPGELTQYLTTTGSGTLAGDLNLTRAPFQPISVNALSAFFTYLIAQNAYIRMLTGSNFVITDNLGTVLAGMGNRVDGDGKQYYLWSGGQDADSATFKVFADGTVDAMKGNFSGFVTHKTTILHEFNIKDFTKREVSAWTGEYENTIQYKNLGQSFAFYATPDGNQYYYSGSGTLYKGDVYVFPTGYGYLDDGLPVEDYADFNGQVSGDFYINLPFFIPLSNDIYGRSQYMSWFPSKENNVSYNGLGLYRNFKSDITASYGGSSNVGTMLYDETYHTADGENVLNNPDWIHYLNKFIGEMANDARELLGTKITLSFYGASAYTGSSTVKGGPALYIRGIYEEVENANTINNVNPEEAYFVGDPIPTTDYITLECKEFDDNGTKIIAWSISSTTRGYYDRYTLGLDDITT